MAVLAVSKSVLAGVVPTFAAAAALGDSFANNGNCVLILKTTGTPATVTVNSIKNCNQGFDHDTVVVLGATAETIIGPFPVDRYGRAPAITYSVVTGLTVAVVSQ